MRIAIVLSGCGVFDGSEIHEAVACMLAVSRRGGECRFFAPDVELETIDHRTKKPDGTRRSVLSEAARLARGEIRPLSDYKAEEHDGLLFPGGFGAAKNLCSFATDGAAMRVLPEVERAIRDTHRLGKPIGALCIAPVLVAKVLGAKVTVGHDADTAEAIEKMGGRHEPSDHGRAVADEPNRVFTAPCYMLPSTVAEIADDAQAVVNAMLACLG
ncbi:MAG: isoprenoid biosynthesis glyoxalase ElbB [Fimbriimonadaceae bacterium]